MTQKSCTEVTGVCCTIATGTSGFCSSQSPPELPVFTRAVKFLFLRKLFRLLFLSLFLSVVLFPALLHARPGVGILAVEVRYPSQGWTWLGVFLQEELSRQLQLNERFSVISPDTMRRWNQRFRDSGQLPSNLPTLAAGASGHNSALSQLKLERVLQISLQKVLNRIAFTWGIAASGENKTTAAGVSGRQFRKIHSWNSPDELTSDLLQDLAEQDTLFEKLIHYPQGYTWEGLRNFYQWKLSSVPAPNTPERQTYKEELETLLSNDPALAALIYFHRAMLLTIEGSFRLPAHVPTLKAAEKELRDTMELHPGNDEHHTLLSLLHYLRKKPLFAKQQANIANQKNPRNGIALILYGLTVGKTPQAGAPYIRQGLRLYPFIADPSPDAWQPYHVLVKDLEPWLIPSTAEAAPGYEELMQSGREDYQARRWKEARRAFEDASALEPTLPEPPLFLARLQLAQQETQEAFSLLSKLQKRFPEHPDIALYLGYIHEKLGQHAKAETLYRQVLHLKPEHHKALLRLGAVLIKRGKREEARSFLESLTRKYPLYTVAWWNLGILYYQIGELELAESAWEESLRLEPDNSQIRVRLEQLRDEIAL